MEMLMVEVVGEQGMRYMGELGSSLVAESDRNKFSVLNRIQSTRPAYLW